MSKKGPYHGDKPIFTAPGRHTGPWHPTDQSLQDMQKHLQTACLIELSTIPLYLYAAYSIKDDPKAVWKIIGIVKQEMLHLGLAGNILNAIGGDPFLYGEGYTPSFPATIFFEDRLKLHMRAATKENVKSFMDLEAPVEPQVYSMKVMDNILPNYESIGEFYHVTSTGLIEMDKKWAAEGKVLWQPSTLTQQLQAADGSWYDDDMRVIWNIQTAKAAMELIIEQGEGSTGTATGAYLSHYQTFKELYEDHELVTYPVPDDPKTKNYEGHDVHAAMVASDAAYCYLLLTLEALWMYDGPERGRLITNNLMVIMLNIIRPMAQFLVQQPNPLEPGRCACVPFNLYQFNAGLGSPKDQLVTLMREAVSKYPALDSVMTATQGLVDIWSL